jgi:hypothetical protein
MQTKKIVRNKELVFHATATLSSSLLLSSACACFVHPVFIGPAKTKASASLLAILPKISLAELFSVSIINPDPHKKVEASNLVGCGGLHSSQLN